MDITRERITAKEKPPNKAETVGQAYIKEGREKIGAQDDHISADRIHNRPAPDLGLEHKIRTLCRNNSAEYHVTGNSDLDAGEEKSN